MICLSSAQITNEQLSQYDTVYQGSSLGSWTAVGEISTAFASTDPQTGNPTLRILWRQQNARFDTDLPIYLSSYKNSVNEFEIAADKLYQ